jgi:hypothetical protein
MAVILIKETIPYAENTAPVRKNTAFTAINRGQAISLPRMCKMKTFRMN